MSETKRDRKGTEIARPSPDDVVPTEASTDPAGLDVMAPQGSRSPDEGFLIAGVGASAGGLDAFSKLVAALPVDAPLALVLVQHLAPEHESALPGLLSARTTLPVVAVEDGTRVESGHVYVMPPNVQIELRGGRLHLLPRPEDRTLHRPVDVFFRSLAAAAGSLAVGVVLSGTGSDGADGMLEIKGVGGVTIAQSPESAAYDGMPGAAIRTGRVDIILPPADIAGELARIARHPMLRAPLASAKAPEVPFHERELARVFALLRAHSGVDFHAYKLPTIARRIMRRMVLHKLDALGAYLRLLESSPAEVKSLYDDVLINVTRFFREPQSFEALASLVFPKIVADHRGDRPVRIWIAACSTGEEGYSVAMALLDYLAEHALHIDLQIFATDLSEGAIEHARLGTYPESIAADVSPERLAHYFAKVEGGYRIHRSVRDLCVFARQDLTSDPPFSKLDLILCRNVLIYMSAALQKKLIHIFHYALKPNGFLMLGQAETIGAGIDLFAVAEKRHRIYAKRASTQAARMNLPLGAPIPPTPPAARKSMTLGPHDGRTLQQETDLVMLDRFAPPGVVVDADMQIVQFRGQTGVYLQPAPGDPTLNLMKMAREGLLYGVRTAVHEARKVGKVAHSDGHRLLQDGTERVVNIEVVPMRVGDRPYLLVLFEDASPPKAEQLPRITRKRPTSRESRIAAELEHELAASRAHLQSIIQELEAANEELQSANEEVLSSNEELQSMNEELDTAKEELQSTNEELNTVNDELHGRNEELSRVNSDLVNLLASVQIAIVIVASDLKIRRFTPMAERALNLIAGDVGRPIGHIKPNIDCPDLETLIHDAIDTRSSREREVRDRQGKWCSLRVRPYKNEDGHVDGAVLSLFDIDDVKRHEATMRQARDFAEAIVETVRQPLCVLDGDLRVRSLNKAFASTFGITEADARGAHFYEIGGARWDAAELRRSLSGIVPTGDRLEGFAVEHRDASGRARAMLLDARRIAGDDERAGLILLAFDDAPGGRGEG